MASSSMIMLSNVSMERLYLSQPPPWNDIQRLSLSHNQSADTRSSQQMLRTCYDKLLHHMYDINSSSSSSSSSTTTIHQINEQLELAAEYCQLKTFRNENTVYLHSDAFHLEVTFDPLTHLPINVVSCFPNDERLICPTMCTALTEKQYRLFREHLNGYASLFTLTAPSLNNDKRIGYTSYKILQQDLERLSKTEHYGKLLEGFQPIFEGLPMKIKLHEQIEGNHSSLPDHVRIIIVPSTTQHYLPIKSGIHIDEKTNIIQLDSSMKSHALATGHFALEFSEHQPSFTLLLTFAQEMTRLTNINTFYSHSKAFNYLGNILPKSKSSHRYQWYISHDQSAVSIRQIPFTNLKQLIHILNIIRQQISLSKYLNYYFHDEFDHDQMEEDEENTEEISLELSFLSSTILSITCAQSYHLSTFLLQMSDINTLPLLINRQQDKESYLSNEKNSLFKLIENWLKERKAVALSPLAVEMKTNPPLEELQKQSNNQQIPKLNRRLSCGPPAKPTWRRATTLRRNQPACLTLTTTTTTTTTTSTTEEKLEEESLLDEEMNPNETTMTTATMREEFTDDDDAFLQSSPSQPPTLQTQYSYQAPILSRPSLSFHPSTLSRCASVSSTQSVSTPPIFGLSPSTPYPGGSTNPNGNIFFPLGKQVSMPDYSPVSSPLTLGTFDPLAFLPANASTSLATDPNNKNSQKKKRRRSDASDDFIQTLSHDNRSSVHATKLTTSTGGDPSNIKRGKKPMDKNAQSQQLVRQKSTSFKVTDSPTTSLLSQQSVTSPDDASNEMKPLKVVIKRVEGGSNAANDDSQQQVMKQRKKQQQQMGNTAVGNIPGAMRKMSGSNISGGPSSSVLVKSESLDMSQFNSESNSMMNMTDGMQQTQRERPRPSSSLSNPSSSLSSSSAASQPRSAPPQPPIVLKIQRSKVGYPGQDQSSSSTTPTTPVPTPTPTPNQSALKEALKNRTRSLPMGANTSKQVTSPPILAAKLTSPSAGITANPLATTSPSVTSLFRIPRKSSSQEVAAKPKTEPTIPNTNSSPILSKTPLIPGPGVRPSMPPAQVGSWQSPPTQQSSRVQQHRSRPPWSQQQQQQPPPIRGRTPITPPNVSAMNAAHQGLANVAQQPRSILKKPSSNENPSSDLLFMPTSDLSGLNEQRTGMNFSLSSSASRNTISPGRYDDNDDDSSPQAQLVIDTSGTPTNNALLPYTIVPGSNTSAMMDSYDSNHDGNGMLHASHQHQLRDESYANLD